MATVTYTASFGTELKFSSHPSASLSGLSATLPDSAVVTNATLAVYCGVSTYNYNADTVMTLTDGAGSSTTIASTCNTGSENRVWAKFGGAPSTQLDWNNLSTVTLSGTDKLTVRTSNSATLTLTYVSYTNCGAPEKVTLGSETAAPGAKVTLSWSGATAGENNPIAGYYIYRSTDSEGDYELLTAVSSTTTSGSAVVSAPTTNEATYYYKVLTVGEVGGFDSEKSVAYADLTCSYSAITAPTTVQISTTNVAPGATATLSWSGAVAGENNAIAGYEVYRANSADGAYFLYAQVGTTSAPVTAPMGNGEAYYFRVKALGSSGLDSDLSGTYAMLTSTYSSPTAPTSVTVEGETTAYALPSATVALSWSGATAGANNPIKGYDIYRDGELLEENLTAATKRFNVGAHDTAGRAYQFTVVTKGEHSDSPASRACTLCSYTDPTAPTTVEVSDSNPPLGVRVTLSWSGAEAGGYNTITGYRIYRSTAVGGTYSLVANVQSTSTSGSRNVESPSTVGGVYYYRVETVGSYSGSGQSDMYATVTAGEASEGEDGALTVIVTPKKRKKRGFVFGDYDTAERGWTLTGWSFPEPEAQTNYVEVPGRSDGPLDLSTSLTGGDPRYNSRELTARFECSDGTRLDRDALLSEMANTLNGMQVEIVFPDDPDRYAVGRLQIETEYSDMAHAAVNVTAVCRPWRYSKLVKQVSVMALATEYMAVLSNSGRRILAPEVEVIGYGSRVRLTCGTKSWTLTRGVYKLPDLTLPQGNTVITYSGNGDLTFTYREAIL